MEASGDGAAASAAAGAAAGTASVSAKSRPVMVPAVSQATPTPYEVSASNMRFYGESAGRVRIKRAMSTGEVAPVPTALEEMHSKLQSMPSLLEDSEEIWGEGFQIPPVPDEFKSPASSRRNSVDLRNFSIIAHVKDKSIDSSRDLDDIVTTPIMLLGGSTSSLLTPPLVTPVKSMKSSSSKEKLEQLRHDTDSPILRTPPFDSSNILDPNLARYGNAAEPVLELDQFMPEKNIEQLMEELVTIKNITDRNIRRFLQQHMQEDINFRFPLSQSYPPTTIAATQLAGFEDILHLGIAILKTTPKALVLGEAKRIMMQLSKLMEYQRSRLVKYVVIEELVSTMSFLFAPCSRLVQFIISAQQREAVSTSAFYRAAMAGSSPVSRKHTPIPGELTDPESNSSSSSTESSPGHVAIKAATPELVTVAIAAPSPKEPRIVVIAQSTSDGSVIGPNGLKDTSSSSINSVHGSPERKRSLGLDHFMDDSINLHQIDLEMELKDSQRKFDEKNDVSMSSSSSTKADEGSSGRSTPHTPSLRSSPLHMLTSAFSSSSGGLETEEKRRNRHRQVSLGQAEAPTGIRKLVDAPKIAAVKTSSRHHRSRSQDMNKSPSQSRRNTPVSTPQSSPANLELSQSSLKSYPSSPHQKQQPLNIFGDGIPNISTESLSHQTFEPLRERDTLAPRTPKDAPMVTVQQPSPLIRPDPIDTTSGEVEPDIISHHPHTRAGSLVRVVSAPNHHSLRVISPASKIYHESSSSGSSLSYLSLRNQDLLDKGSSPAPKRKSFFSSIFQTLTKSTGKLFSGSLNASEPSMLAVIPDESRSQRSSSASSGTTATTDGANISPSTLSSTASTTVSLPRMTELTRKLSGRRKESSPNKPTEAVPSIPDVQVVCRICEETVRSSELEEHSRICRTEQKCLMSLAEADQRLGVLIKNLDARRIEHNSKSTAAPSEVILDLSKIESIAANVVSLNRDDSNAIDVCEDLKLQLEKILSKSASSGAQTPDPEVSDEKSDVRSFGRRVVFLLEDKLATIRTYQAEVLLKRKEKDSRSGGLFMSLFAAALNVNHSRRPSTPGSPASSLGRITGKRALEKGASTKTKPAGSVPRTSINDFQIIKPISKGAFGKVYLARKTKTNDLYAIKVLKKNEMVRKNMVNHVFAERTVLSLVRTPYVVRMFFAFQSKDYLYLVMEYLPGGDLSSLLQVHEKFTEPRARMYAAEIVLALEYLHKHQIAHHDLKPDNILVNAQGHIKLTDFGLSRISVPQALDTNVVEKILSADKFRNLSQQTAHETPPLGSQRRSTMRRSISNRHVMGTPDYLAPELLLGYDGSGPEADWWALGVCLFEFLDGCPPFNAETPELIFKNILDNYINWPNVPEDMSFEAQDLIRKLLTSDPKLRINAAEVKQHPFFKDIDWENLRNMPMDFVPKMSDPLDTSFFDGRNERYGPIENHVDTSSSTSLDNLDRRVSLDMMNASRSPDNNEPEFELFSHRNIDHLQELNTELMSPLTPSANNVS